MSLMDYVWRYDRIILPVLAFVVGFVVANPGSGNGTASVLESTKNAAEFEKAYQQQIDELNTQVKNTNKELSDVKSENGNLTDIVNQYSVDTDSDGIPDYVEEMIGTNPREKDTDHDGFGDLTEIKSGHSPIVAGTKGQAKSSAPVAATSSSITARTPPTTVSAPKQNGSECFIKGTSDKVYYLPGRPDYDTVEVTTWLCSIEDALKQGYRPPLK